MAWNIAFLSIHGDPLAPLGGSHHGGQNVYVKELSRYLGALGLKVDVYSRRESPRQDSHQKYSRGAAVYRIPAGPPEVIQKEKTLSLLPEIASWIQGRISERGDPYRLIHSHYYFSGAVGLDLKRVSGTPLVHTFHSLGAVKQSALQDLDSSPDTRFEIEQKICRGADRIIATCQQEKIDLITHYQAPPEKINIIPCGVNLELFQPQDQLQAKSEIGYTRNDFLITFIGRLEERKGIDTLLEAASQIQDADLQILIVGGPPTKKAFLNRSDLDQPAYRHYRDLVTAYRLEDQVTFVGGKPQTHLSTYYSAADVTVIPSYYEPFGLTALEALACSSPVIASRVGGLQSTVQEGRVGALFEPRQADQLAEKIRIFQDHPEMRVKFRKNARPYVEEHFSWINVSKQIALLYRELTGDG